MKRLSIHNLFDAFLRACSDSDIEPNPLMQAKQQRITMSFRCGEMSLTRAQRTTTELTTSTFIFTPRTAARAHHVYIDPIQSVVLELPKGDYTLYAVANLGHDVGDQAQDFVQSLRVERNPLTPEDAPFPMSAEQVVSVNGDMQIAVSLVRAVAKVNFSYTVAADFAKTFRVKSVQLRSVPRSATLFGSSRADNAGAVADMAPWKHLPQPTLLPTTYWRTGRDRLRASVPSNRKTKPMPRNMRPA